MNVDKKIVILQTNMRKIKNLLFQNDQNSPFCTRVRSK